MVALLIPTFMGKVVSGNGFLLMGVNVVQILVEQSALDAKASVTTETLLSNNSLLMTYRTFYASLHFIFNFNLHLELTDPGLASKVTVPPEN